MWTEQELEALEQMQHEMSEEEFALIVAILISCRDDLKKEILSFYEQYGSDGVVTYVGSRQRVGGGNNRMRVAVLHDSIDDIFASSFLKIDTVFKDTLMDIIQSEMDFFDVEIDIDDLLDLKWGVDDKSWNTRLWAHRDKWSALIKQDLKKSFLRGDDVLKVIDNLVKRFESAEKALQGLHLTEYNAVESETRYRIFKQLAVKRYQYFATLDERTCDTCGAMHGQVFPMTAFEIGATAPPIHNRCRCFITPIVD
jgi:SPP1 gp7 family putative phage head morphogenesis protein